MLRNGVLIVMLGLVASGCYVQSLNVFYTDDVKVDLREIAGDWKPEIQTGESVTNKQITSWKFTTNTVETYDGDNIYSELKTVYFKVAGTYFMDFTAGDLSKGDKGNVFNGFWAAGIAPVHSLCKVDIKGDRLTLIPPDAKWFTDRIEKKKGRLSLSYVKSMDDSGNCIFTATPKEWVAFLKKYKDSEEVFNPKGIFVFTRKE